MPFMSKIHVQTMASAEMLAIIAKWLDDQGTPAVSMSNLLTMSIEALADAIVQGGGVAISSVDEADYVLSQIGRGRARRPMIPRVVVNSRMSEEAIKREVLKFKGGDTTSASYNPNSRLRRAPSSEDGEILASEADEGEFSASALRRAQHEEK